VAGKRFVIWCPEGKEEAKRKVNYREPFIGRPEEQ
jgi:hypothetical protein